ncbi:hypothetical protein DOTSEDRAFT_68531 [Dothistroma septosporum NZE10]|uniref:Vacuolar protein sorting/targeting protein 10 n=1 Tax=Dothistroma septosporum (strain NZE10 / CBS 128990) TaxID=675120 RepID=N1Q4M4_DOTSN|nr:hypothetical protein DOTSEDRAFT_68531 [Dothistroma septosporum NZE10]
MRQLRLLLAVAVNLLALGAAGKKDEPTIEETAFENQPRNILFFEDSDTVLLTDAELTKTYRSTDGGFNWELCKSDEDEIEGVMEVLKHPLDKKTAVILGHKNEHWITHDRGESWTPFKSEKSPAHTRPGISFHATDPERMLYNAETCRGLICTSQIYYTIDGFKTEPKKLPDDLETCIWAKSTDIFTTGDEDLDKNRILCITQGSWFSTSNKVVYSDDFFPDGEDRNEPTMSDGRTIQDITNIAAVKKYIVFAAKSDRTAEMAMYVTDDTKIWHRAEFGEHKLEEGAYTLLESTNYSMQVDVMTTTQMSPIGVLLTSNSNGTFFTKNLEHTNRNSKGYVDFEKVSNIQGIVLANAVDNWEEVERKWLADKKIVSKISFDDGRTWEDMKVDKDTLHLHSVTSPHNVGRIFSSPAPGIVMGVGNTGKYLKEYEEGDVYVSDDAGLNWRLAIEKPHIYEFGAQGSVLVAVREGETDTVKWSIDHGRNWEKVTLKDKVKPMLLTTTPDSTSTKFLLVATRGGGSKTEHLTIAMNFKDLSERKCKDKDMEKWSARVDDDGKPTCIMGHTQLFTRRKADSDCVVLSDHFEDPEEERKHCKCTKEDFECDYNFKKEGDKCVQAGPIVAPEGACDNGKTKFKGTSGYRLIPGNDCDMDAEGSVNLAEEVNRECNETKAPPVNGDITSEVTKFDGDRFVEYYYLEREPSASGDDESIIMRTERREVWKTHDHGKHWEQVLKDEEILAIYPHQYINDYVYMITPSKTVHYSTDRAHKFHKFEAPEEPNRDSIQVLSFHPTNKDWLIWTGSKDCKDKSADCLTVAHVSEHGGEGWETLLRSVRKCQFVYRDDREGSDNLIFCEQYENENKDSSLLLLSSDDFFKHQKELKRDVINFATMAEYIVVAMRDTEQETLRVDTSIDGVSFANAQFPHNFHVPHQQAYTVLDSSTHAIFLHVTVNNIKDQEYGSIIKSNSNGTSYVLSVAEVNRNDAGYVDFEKMQGLEGVAVINKVANVREVDGGSSKKLQTWITHNDGGRWEQLTMSTKKPSEGIKFDCQLNDPKCRLHLHGYTERKDPRDTYSSASAVGLMIGTGNVGEFLDYKKNADTFITRDGGLTWAFAAPGNWMWEYGDQGSIIVIVKEDEPTDTIRYTLDEGSVWHEHRFGEEMIVEDITTVPSDTSRNFLLWGKIGSSIATVNIDFSGLKERSEKCQLDEKKPDDANLDYDLWSPEHPYEENGCLFGHIAQYHRKKVDRDCYNGEKRDHLHSILKNCTCVRDDFECDYNYERQADQSCGLVAGLAKPDASAVCKKNPDLTEYYETRGYRRIPLSTCEGGQTLDKPFPPKPCPGKEEEYKKKHGISGAGLFFAIVIPIAAAAGIGYWVWKNWDGKFGRIRLGDSMGGGFGDAFDGDAPWVRYPVMAVSGTVAVLAAIPMLVDSIRRTISSRIGRSSSGYTRPYTSRSSFQRGRGDYAVVDPDEGELLGEDSDEDV